MSDIVSKKKPLTIVDKGKMVDEAKTHADEDKNKKESVEVRNQADSMVYSTEKSLGEHGDKLEATDKDNIQKAIDELKEVLKDESASSENIKSKLDALNTAAMKLGEIMYKQNQQDAGQQSQGKADGENKAEDNTTKSDKEEDIVGIAQGEKEMIRERVNLLSFQIPTIE